MIVSADFEEQYVIFVSSISLTTLVLQSRSVIALTLGPNSNHPCTGCLVSKEDLTDLTSTFEERSAKQSKSAYEEFLDLNTRGTMGQAQQLLKNYSLRPVEGRILRFYHSACVY